MRVATFLLRPLPPASRTPSALARAFALACLLALAAPAPASRAADDAPAAGRVLTIGSASHTPREHYAALRAMADWLATDCTDLGVSEVRVLFTPNLAALVAAFAQSRVDVVSETLLGAAELTGRAGAEAALLERRSGVRRYHTVFFTRQSSLLTGLQGLRGKVLALEDPGSTSAGFIPLQELAGQGIPTREIRPEELNLHSPAPDVAGYVYVYDERNAALAVRNGETDAGAMSDTDWNDPETVPPVLRSALRIFHISPAVPRSFLLVRTALPAPLKRRIAETFLQADRRPERLRVLRGYHATDGYEPPTEDDRAALARARATLHIPAALPTP